MKRLMTIGYGNSSPEKFLARLKDAGVAVVLDVRRKGSKSWNGKYNQGNSMGSLLWGDMNKEIPEIEYGTWPSLANKFDELWAYQRWLQSKPTSTSSAAGFLSELQYKIKKNKDSAYCLLCAERDAYKDGKVNCHRVYVADALVELLGSEWEVKHL